MSDSAENLKNRENGEISIHTENILPIIKKWLYSDKEIFIRELVSNGVDAITKLKHLSGVGEFKGELGELGVEVKIDAEGKTLSFIDNGIGMTREEIKKYINQIAFSGAEDFISKYKESDKEEDQIIGHFGLGFYSAFMVSTKVEIFTKSYIESEQAVHWENDGGTDFSINDIDKSDRSTEIRLSIDEESLDFLKEDKVREVILKYCDFLPFPIKLNGKVINTQNPLWMKSPRDTKEEEYKEFYTKLFPMDGEPLFWLHFEVEVPFRLRGILYFPRLRHELDSSKGRIKLFCNQVFVSDNANEIIPEFLTLLQGCLDIPDIPLNVSRSYLQNDPYVRKISEYITRKVADKLTSIFKTDRPEFESFWDDIGIFIKFGMIREEKFYDKVKDVVIFKTTDDVYKTLAEYREKNKGINKEQHGKEVILYATNEEEQVRYINLIKSQGYEALLVGTLIDIHFLQFLETKDSTIHFMRVDSDDAINIIDESKKSKVVDENNKTSDDKIKEIFESVLKKDEKSKVQVKVEPLKDEKLSAMVVLPEFLRRFKDMNMGMKKDKRDADFLNDYTLLVNSNNRAVQNVSDLNSTGNSEKVALLVEQIHDLALLSQNNLKGEELLKFLKRSEEILEKFNS